MDDQTYWHEGEPRIIASGRWEQDKYGAASYIPDHIRPSTAGPADADAAPVSDEGERTGADGYRICSDAVWAAARRDYLAGDAAEAVCARPFSVEASAFSDDSDVSDSVFDTPLRRGVVARRAAPLRGPIQTFQTILSASMPGPRLDCGLKRFPPHPRLKAEPQPRRSRSDFRWFRLFRPSFLSSPPAPVPSPQFQTFRTFQTPFSSPESQGVTSSTRRRVGRRGRPSRWMQTATTSASHRISPSRSTVWRTIRRGPLMVS
ncbi:hypothetical protein ABIE19_000292 [Brevundimonas faecalis]|uniref:Uncharacterized protein n=1 Tax=Brevundimonas faecalis TaxID=947378 RepID=A0ABV2R7V6_9CAUL